MQPMQELNLGQNAPQLNRLPPAPPVAPIDVNLNYQNEDALQDDNHAGQDHQQHGNAVPGPEQANQHQQGNGNARPEPAHPIPILIRTASYDQCLQTLQELYPLIATIEINQYDEYLRLKNMESFVLDKMETFKRSLNMQNMARPDNGIMGVGSKQISFLEILHKLPDIDEINLSTETIQEYLTYFEGKLTDLVSTDKFLKILGYFAPRNSEFEAEILSLTKSPYKDDWDYVSSYLRKRFRNCSLEVTSLNDYLSWVWKPDLSVNDAREQIVKLLAKTNYTINDPLICFLFIKKVPSAIFNELPASVQTDPKPTWNTLIAELERAESVCKMKSAKDVGSTNSVTLMSKSTNAFAGGSKTERKHKTKESTATNQATKASQICLNFIAGKCFRKDCFFSHDLSLMTKFLQNAKDRHKLNITFLSSTRLYALQAVSTVLKQQIVLDSASNVHVFKDSTLLTNIRSCDPVSIEGVTQDKIHATSCGSYKTLDEVYINEHVPANILSYSKLSDMLDIQWSQTNQQFTVTFDPNDVMVFKRFYGLYLYDGSDMNQNICMKINSSVEKVKHVHEALSHASEQVMLQMLQFGLLSDVSAADIKDYFATNTCVPCIQGRFTYQSNRPNVDSALKIGAHLHADIMQITDHMDSSAHLYLVIVDEASAYVHCVYLPNKSTDMLYEKFLDVVQFYKKFNHVVNILFSDSEANFKALDALLSHHSIVCIHASAGEHCVLVERYIRTIREKAIKVKHALLFELPSDWIDFLIQFVVQSLNMSISTRSSSTLPLTAVTGVKNISNIFFQLPFGSIVMVKIPNYKSSALVSKGSLSIVVGRSILTNGGIRVYDVNSGKIHDRRLFQFVIVNEQMLNDINQSFIKYDLLPGTCDMPSVKSSNRTIVLQPHQGDSHHDSHLLNVQQYYDTFSTSTNDMDAQSHYTNESDDSMSDSGDTSLTTTEPTLAQSDYSQQPSLLSSLPSLPLANVYDDAADSHLSGLSDLDVTREMGQPNAISTASSATSSVYVPSDTTSNDASNTTPATSTNTSSRSTTGSRSRLPKSFYDIDKLLCTRTRGKTPEYLVKYTNYPLSASQWTFRPQIRGFTQSQLSEVPTVEEFVVNNPEEAAGVGISLITVSKGITLDEKLQALKVELDNWTSHDVYELVRPQDLSPDIKKSAVQCFPLFTKKYAPDGCYIKTKARIVLDGSQQTMETIGDINTNSPTIDSSILKLILCFIIYRRWAASTMDVTAAFLHSNMNVQTFARFPKFLTDMVVKVNPVIQSYVCADGSMTLKLKRSVYGLVQAPALWYKLLVSTFTKLGFATSKFDPCLFIKRDIILVIHVDDIFVGASSVDLIKQFHADLEKQFSNVSLEISDRLNYVGLSIEFDRQQQLVKLSQVGYIQQMLDEYKIVEETKTPGSDSLFKYVPTYPRSESSKKFLSILMTVAYAAATRPDISVSVAYLSTRALDPSEHDFMKLSRILFYLKATKTLVLSLKPRDMQIHAYIDSAFNVYDDAKSITGAAICIGDLGNGEGGLLFAASKKQRIVARSSAEAELIAIHDCIDRLIMIRNVSIELGMDPLPAVIHQDNKSTIMLAQHGGALSKRSKHINLRYFYVSEKVEANQVSIVYTPTKLMIADFLTKPLQGKQFYYFRKCLMQLEE